MRSVGAAGILAAVNDRTIQAVGADLHAQLRLVAAEARRLEQRAGEGAVRDVLAQIVQEAVDAARVLVGVPGLGLTP